MCLACLTHDINIDAKLASGISIIEHSLVFDSVEGKLFLVDMIKTCPIGDIVIHSAASTESIAIGI